KADIRVLGIDRTARPCRGDKGAGRQRSGGRDQRRDRCARLRRVLAGAVAELRVKLAVYLKRAKLWVAENDLRVRSGRDEQRANRECGCLPLHAPPPRLTTSSSFRKEELTSRFRKVRGHATRH